MKLNRGESAEIFAMKFDIEPPVIDIIYGKHSRERPYLWIGGQHGPCYATLEGEDNLRSLANDILIAVGPEKKR